MDTVVDASALIQAGVRISTSTLDHHITVANRGIKPRYLFAAYPKVSSKANHRSRLCRVLLRGASPTPYSFRKQENARLRKAGVEVLLRCSAYSSGFVSGSNSSEAELMQ
jgi:hypothetical protein